MPKIVAFPKQFAMVCSDGDVGIARHSVKKGFDALFNPLKNTNLSADTTQKKP